MSTAYPPRFIKYFFNAKKERNAAKAAAMKPGFYGHLPPDFGLYYAGPGDDFLSQHFHLSALPGDDGEPPRQDLFAVTFHKGPGTRQIAIYSNTDHASTPMAIINNENPYSFSSKVKLAGLDDTFPRYEKVRFSGLNSNTYSFTLNGDVFELHEDIRSRPRMRRVYRLSPLQASQDAKAKAKSSVSRSQDSDAELIADWSEGSLPNREGRLARFRFISSTVAQDVGDYGVLIIVSAVLAACQQGPAIEGTTTWQEEKMLEKSNYR